MDGRRFDVIARAAARGTNRRQILRAIGASIAGGIGLSARAELSAAQAPSICFQDSDCIGDAADACTGAHCDGGTCTFFIASCIPGYVCCGNGACCPAAAPCQSDADCLNDDPDPCTGVSCENGTCVPYILSCVEGFVCCGGECVITCGAVGIASGGDVAAA
jgi:hypothetical protein